MQYKDEITALRQRIPIGVRHAAVLLETTCGDLDLAEEKFKIQLVDIVVCKTQLTCEEAIKYLVNNNFDINTSFKNIDIDRYTLTERILMRYKDKEKALRYIIQAIEESNDNLRDGHWLDHELLKSLPAPIYCFMIVQEWLNYAGW